MSSFEFGFHYAGPRKAEDNRKCPTCVAFQTKECPTHGQRYEEGCGHCASAQGAPCQGHWGLEAALKEFGTRPEVAGNPEALADWDFISKKILSTTSPLKNITVSARSDRNGGVEGGIGLTIDVHPRP